jgi:HD-GYP domain-containing protein (c-di-GMP phosphodiesterase class II)
VSRMTINACLVDSPLAPTQSASDAAWSALERFVQQSQANKKEQNPFRAVLTATCDATGAQTAFLYSDQLGRIVDMVGRHALAPQWCRDFCATVAHDLPRGGVWSASDGTRASSFGSGGGPQSACLLPVDTPRPAWLVALGYDDESSLRASDLRVMRVMWRLQESHQKHSQMQNNLRETLFGVVRCLSAAVDAKDPYTCGHSERVARMAVRLGEEMRLPRGEISDLYLAGLLHDVGKIGIRDNVLLKEGPLTPDEFAHMKEHPTTGERIISNVTRLSYLRPGVRGHHERYDGRGYPDGLARESIPEMARILAVADSCDAMMSARRYRPALPRARIEEIMREGSGSQWDPRIVEVFFACRNELFAVCQRGLGQSVLMAVERAAGADVQRNILSQRPSSRTEHPSPHDVAHFKK